MAVAVKNTRNALIGFVVPGYALYWANRGGVEVARGLKARAGFVWATFPKFVLGFIAISGPATAGLLHKPDVTSLGNLSKWAFLLTFAGVGLKLDLWKLARAGLAWAGLAHIRLDRRELRGANHGRRRASDP